MKCKIKLLLISALILNSVIAPASALEYSYSADLYSNYFYSPTSSNHALDLDLASDSGGSTIVLASSSMGGDASQSGTLANSPIIPVGSYIDPWGPNVNTQIETDESLNGLAGLAFNRLAGDFGQVGNVPNNLTTVQYTIPTTAQYAVPFNTICATAVGASTVAPCGIPVTTVGAIPYTTNAGSLYANCQFTERSKVTSTCGHFGAVSIGNRNLFAYVYPSASTASMQKGAGHVDGTSVWNGNVVLSGHNRGSWPHFSTLKNVRLGDIITYKTSLGTRTYRVTYSGRIGSTDTSVLTPTFNNQITMLTCVANEPAYRYCVIGQEIGTSLC